MRTLERWIAMCHSGVSTQTSPLSSMYRCISLVLAVLLLVGCWSRHKHNEAADTGPHAVTIEWLGHGCFRVTSSIGLTIITDPFNPHTNKVATVPADIVLITHEDDTSNYTDLVRGSPVIFRSSMAGGVNRASGVLIRGTQTSSENLAAAAAAKLNVAYTWVMDGIRFCDLGRIEDAVTPSEALNIGNVDVLFMPAGATQNFSEDKRRFTIERLRPKIIVSTTGEWSSRQSNVVHIRGNRFTLTASQLPTTTTVYVPSIR
ncbi:MAG: MBL fold metallo-hydrolase [Verrucomicrobia bacterium]|nr:MBL fold metallo-hydrolase [Verrucomicrobiota bacterium]